MNNLKRNFFNFTKTSLLSLALLLSIVGMLTGISTESAEKKSEASGFKPALPGYVYHFPKDHAAHPDYKTEWWYYNGHLTTQQKDNKQVSKTLGYQLTFFRSGIKPNSEAHESTSKNKWQLNELNAAHFALSDQDSKTFWSSEKLNRTHPAIAQASSEHYHVFNENWKVTLKPDGSHHLLAKEGQNQINLILKSEKPPAIHGKAGVSQKASCVGCASHYYSLTRMKTTGTVTLHGKDYPVAGYSWMDHEFGSNQLASNQTGWDWFSIQLDDNSDWMFYQLRQNKAIDPNSSGSVTEATGGTRHLNLSEFDIKVTRQWQSPKTKGRYPMGWIITVPKEKLTLTVTPVFDNQELNTGQSTGVTYWEGRAKVTGVHGSKKVSGNAYVEMTGYAEAFKQKI